MTDIFLTGLQLIGVCTIAYLILLVTDKSVKRQTNIINRLSTAENKLIYLNVKIDELVNRVKDLENNV